MSSHLEKHLRTLQIQIVLSNCYIYLVSEEVKEYYLFYWVYEKMIILLLSHSEVVVQMCSVKKGVLRNFEKLTRKTTV